MDEMGIQRHHSYQDSVEIRPGLQNVYQHFTDEYGIIVLCKKITQKQNEMKPVVGLFQPWNTPVVNKHKNVVLTRQLNHGTLPGVNIQ